MGNTGTRRSGELRRAVVLLLLLGSLATSAGCGPEKKHKVLTVVFTGVPPPEGEVADGEAESPGGSADQSLAALAARRAAKPQREPEFWVHGPYGAQECTRCHADSSQGDQQAEGWKGGRMSLGLELTAPDDELCQTCHEMQTEEFTSSRQLELHMPVEAGLCLECHHPHVSQRRYMLRGADNRVLCAICHDVEGLNDGPAHVEARDVDCMECHNPHMGRNSSLLRADYDESVDNYADL